MTHFTIDEVPIPASIDAPDAADFIEMTHVRNEIEAAVVGSNELSYRPAELLPHWQDPYDPQRLFVARVDGRIVGRAVYNAPIEEGSREAWLEVDVLEAFRRQGIGKALYDLIARLAAEDDRPVLQCYIIHKRVAGDEQLPSPTGFGAVPRNSPETRFLLARGYRLEQVERMSRLPLPVDPHDLESRIAAAKAAAGEDYALIRWTGRTPEDRVADLAVMRQRMSIDAPSAGMDFAEESWDEARIRTLDDGRDVSPRTMLTVGAVHVPTGRLVAFNELSVPPETERAVEQQDTLVLREHRGHRLGMLVKCANLKQLAETFPGHPAITTFNAEENRHMLDVNEALGFVPVGYGGGWRLDLSP